MTRAAAPRRRSLHPVAWWVWAAGLAICAMRTNNPFLLALIGAVACVVVSARRSSAPWSRSIAFFLRLGVLVIVIRIVIEILFGQRGVPGHVLFTLPQVPLPSWAAAVSIGGPVTLESILNAFVLGLQIAVILLCFGAANSLASPYRLLRSLPAVLYETGVAVTVALSFTPELVQSIGIVRQARRQRGIPTRGLRGMRGVAVPVLESALDRSLQLATSMDARGYGRRLSVGKMSRRLASGATVGGLLLMAVGLYGVIDGARSSGSDFPILAVAAVLCGVGLAVGGRRTARSRYRPDPWRQPEWIVAGSGLVALVTMSVARALDVPGLTISFSPSGVSRASPCCRSWGSWSRWFRPFAAPNPCRRRRQRSTRPQRASSARRPAAGSVDRRSRPLGGADMITFDQVSFTYTEAARPTLHRVSLDIPEGELCVVVGETGTGKSTLLRAINGLVPHFSGGTLAGTVTVDGRTTKDNRPRDLADVVGFVGQNPLASFVTETVEDELAYTMENLGVPADAMRRRVEDAVDLLGLQDLRDRSLRALSGGQQQRVAIGAVLTASPRLARPRRAHVRPRSGGGRRGPERAGPPGARPRPDRRDGGTPAGAGRPVRRPDHPGARRRAPLVVGPPEVVMRSSSVAPPLVELGRLVGWEPLPLSVRDARRQSAPLRERLAPLTPPRRAAPPAARRRRAEAASVQS